MARSRHRIRTQPGSLEQLAAVLWRTVLEIDALLSEPECPPERVLRAGHCLAQLANSYRGVLEVASIEARLAALERVDAEKNGRYPGIHEP
jgi:hypothetical protein